MHKSAHFSRISAIEEKQVELEESVAGIKKNSLVHGSSLHDHDNLAF